MDYNTDTNINDINDIAPNKNTNAQIAAKKSQKIRNLARKKSYQRLPKKTDDDVFLKEVPVQPRDRWLEKQKIMLNL